MTAGCGYRLEQACSGQGALHAAEASLAVLLVVTVAAVVLAVWRPSTLDPVAAVMLVAASSTWLALNGPVEGRTLWVVAPTHGLTSGDLLAVPALALAVALGGRYLAVSLRS